MEINREINNGVYTIFLKGKLDTLSSPMLDSEVTKIEHDITKVVLDMSGCDYISSSGLRSILILAKKMEGNGELVITQPNDYVREVFEMTGFSELLTIK